LLYRLRPVIKFIVLDREVFISAGEEDGVLDRG
jgi:hypothetical protein